MTLTTDTCAGPRLLFRVEPWANDQIMSRNS
jgi:hypothetical protein